MSDRLTGKDQLCLVCLGLFGITFTYKLLLPKLKERFIESTHRRAFNSFTTLNDSLRNGIANSEFLTQNSSTLLNILKTNQNTVYGKKYNFSNIKSIKEYQSTVPLIFYNDIYEEIERIAQGDQQVLSSAKVVYFATSSGTTGKQKLLPITFSSFKMMNILISHATGAAMNFLHKEKNFQFNNSSKMCAVSYNPSNHKKTSGGIPFGPLSQMRRALPWWLQMMFKVIYSTTSAIPSDITDLVSHFETNMLIQVLFSIMEEKISCIFMAFGSIVCHFFSLLESHFNELLECIKQASLTPCKNFTANIDPNTVSYIDKYIQSNYSKSRRLARVSKLQEIDDFKGIIPKIWPDILYVACSVTGGFTTYEESVRYLSGDVPIVGSVYLASEACIGFQYNIAGDYILDPNTAFYEFIPEENASDEKPTTLNATELEIGKNYEIVITSISGFCRYRIGDVIKVVGKVEDHPDIPLFRLAYRTGSILDAWGEKTTEQQVQDALDKTAMTFDCTLVNFTSFLDLEASPVVYLIFAEFSREFTEEEQEKINEEVDTNLQACHPFYDLARSQNKLGQLICHVTKQGKFGKYHELLVSGGTSAFQLKTPRLLKNPSHVQFFLENSS